MKRKRREFVVFNNNTEDNVSPRLPLEELKMWAEQSEELDPKNKEYYSIVEVKRTKLIVNQFGHIELSKPKV